MYIGVRLATGHGLHPWRKSILLQQSSSHWLPVASWLRVGACKPFPHQAEILTSGVWNRSCEGIYSCKEFTVQCSCPFQRILPHGSPQRPLDLTISPPLLLQCSLSLEGKGYTEDICSAIKRMALYTLLRMDTARGDFKWNIPIQKDKYEIFSNICGTHIFFNQNIRRLIKYDTKAEGRLREEKQLAGSGGTCMAVYMVMMSWKKLSSWN